MTLLRGGHIDALVVLATSSHLSIRTVTANAHSMHSLSSSTTRSADTANAANSKNNFLFQEAFLATYRTILEPIELVNKLIVRYRKFGGGAKHKASAAPQQPSRCPVCMNEEECYSLAKSGSIDATSACPSANNLMGDRFDLNRLKINNKYSRMALLASRNSLTLLVRVLDDLE